MVDQQLDLPGRWSWPAVGGWVRAGRPGRPPARRSGRTCPGHRRLGGRRPAAGAAPHDPLPGGQPVAFQPARDVAAVRHGPGPLRPACPSQLTSWPCPGVRAGTVAWSSWRPAWSTATTVSVSVCGSMPTSTMLLVSCAGWGPRAGRRAGLSWGGATLRSSHAGRPTTQPWRHNLAKPPQPARGSVSGSQPQPRRSPPPQRAAHPPSH
jgi:hypothetical protein